MLLVFRQHRLASSATGGASVMLHTRSSSGAFAGECAELPTESRKLCTAARRCGGLGVKPRVCLFFAGVSFLRQKRNAETREV